MRVGIRRPRLSGQFRADPAPYPGTGVCQSLSPGPVLPRLHELVACAQPLCGGRLMSTQLLRQSALSDPVGVRSPLRLSVISEAFALEKLRPQWEELLASSASAEPMLSSDWLLT